MKKIFIIRTINALLALVLMGVLLMAFYYQFFYRELPCIFCILQRAAMAGVGVGVVMHLRFGIHLLHYAIAFFSAFFGCIVAVWQILLNICSGVAAYGVPVLGLHLYTWSFVVFCCSILIIVNCLFFYSPEEEVCLPMNRFEKSVSGFVFVMVLANVVFTAFA